MKAELVLKNRLKETRTAAVLSHAQLAALVGGSRNTTSSIETGPVHPPPQLAPLPPISLGQKFAEVVSFY